MGEHKREPVSFPPNQSVAVALEKTVPFEASYGKWGYWLCGDRIMFLPAPASIEVGKLDPQPGEEFYVTKREVRNGRRAQIDWMVTSEPVIVSHTPAPNSKPGDPQAAARATGIEETALERNSREAVEIRQRAADNIRRKIALEQSGQAVPAASPQLPMPDPESTPRKPLAIEPPSTPALPAPQAPAAQEPPQRAVWMPHLVEICRSFNYKLNAGEYESRDFFCSQKAECRPEDADLVSDRLYEFCKRQVLRAVEQYVSESRPRRSA